MQLLHLTLPTGPENLALDEALLDEAEANPEAAGEVLRFWESPEPMVVIGRSSRAAEEVDLDVCRARKIPVLRRTSGGAAIVAGPGCLMYTLVLSYALRPALKLVDHAHQFVLEQVAASLREQLPEVQVAGISDLAHHDRKISGNSMRCKRTHFLYHGTVLYNFPVELIEACLRTPPRQPAYRDQRRHADFIRNASIDVDAFMRSLSGRWKAAPRSEWPRERVEALVAEKYASEQWNLGR